MDVIENIYRANEVFVAIPEARSARNHDRNEASARQGMSEVGGHGSQSSRSSLEKRLDFQHQALTSLKILAYFAEMAMTQKCILPKQYEQIAKLATDCQHLIGAWINSDNKRWQS
jgi:hypothetical protein